MSHDASRTVVHSWLLRALLPRWEHQVLFQVQVQVDTSSYKAFNGLK